MFKKILEKITGIFAPMGAASAGHLSVEKKHPLDGPIRAAEEKTFGVHKEQPKQEEIKEVPVVQEPIANIILTPSIVIPEETLTVIPPSTVDVKPKRKPAPKKAKTKSNNSKAVVRKTVKKDTKKNGTL